jgi:thioredoxin 1
MKETTKKFLMIVGLLVAVNGIILYKHVQNKKQVAQLSDDSIIGKGKPVLLELGSHGCAPCAQMMPILVELATEQSDFGVAFIDIAASQAAIEKYDMEGSPIPVQVFFDANGKELYRQVGFHSKEQILAKWNELVIEPAP